MGVLHTTITTHGPQEPREPTTPAESATPAEAATPPPKPMDAETAKGQRTAIITGAISIIFGVLYLGLVSFLDIRGGELLPPPPEAFIP